jgi:hypothetical protein
MALLTDILRKQATETLPQSLKFWRIHKPFSHRDMPASAAVAATGAMRGGQDRPQYGRLRAGRSQPINMEPLASEGYLKN